MEIDRVNVRNYRSEDRNIVREISVESSILNKYRDVIFSDDIIADLLTSYFIDHEPASCFVVENDDVVIGYVLGAKNVRRMRRVIRKKVLPSLGKQTILSGQLFQRQNIMFLKSMVLSFFKKEFKVPDFSYDYPATLHINIKSQFRGQNIGSMLINHFLQYLQENGINGIHFGVLSDNAKRFFLKMNFKVLFEGEYTFLRHLTGENFPHYIMGKKL
jgi:ribosomal protein S18 acetylase RimI-like enzyme